MFIVIAKHWFVHTFNFENRIIKKLNKLNGKIIFEVGKVVFITGKLMFGSTESQLNI